MSISIFIYDSASPMLPQGSPTVQFLETDHWGARLDRQPNTNIGPPPPNAEYGAHMVMPTSAQPVKLWVSDTAKILAPAALGEFRSDKAVALHVTLYQTSLT